MPEERELSPLSNTWVQVKCNSPGCWLLIIAAIIICLQVHETNFWISSFLWKYLNAINFAHKGVLETSELHVYPFSWHWVNLDTPFPSALWPSPSQKNAASQSIILTGNKCAAVNIMVSPNASTVKTNDRKCSSPNRHWGQKLPVRIFHAETITIHFS